MPRFAASTRSGRCVLAAILVAVVLIQPGTASAEGLVDGTYPLTITTTKDCQHADATGTGVVHLHPGYTYHVDAKVAQNGSVVSLRLAGRAEVGSIDTDLNFDVPVEMDHWIGHFTILSDGGATISGQVVGACSGVTGPYMKITGRRTSGGPSPSPSPSHSSIEDQSGYSAAKDAWNAGPCDVSQGQPLNECDVALKEGRDWLNAMLDDTNALTLSEEYKIPLAELTGSVYRAAQLGSLKLSVGTPDGTCALKPAFPLLNGLLPLFGRLFIAGIRFAGNHRLDLLKNVAAAADSLLLQAVNGELYKLPGAKCSA
jgi:hypothetical protein